MCADVAMPTSPAVGLVALDVDGTIVGPGGLFPAAAALLDALAEAAVPVALCSARPLASLRVLARDHAGVRYGAGLQGAVVERFDPDAAWIGSWAIAADDAAAIVDRARRRGFEVWWYTADRWIVERSSVAVEAEIRAAWIEPDLTASFDGLPAPHKLLVLGDGAVIDGDLTGWCANAGLATRTSGGRDLEIISGAVPPTKGLTVIAADLGVDPSAVVAAGDGDNDVAMLRYAGRPVAFPPVAATASWPGLTRLAAPQAGGLAELTRLLQEWR